MHTRVKHDVHMIFASTSHLNLTLLRYCALVTVIQRITADTPGYVCIS